jgi:branched-chain amino acid transport system substrate-binding protein
MHARSFSILLVLVCVALVLNGCGPTTPAPTPAAAETQAGEPYKIGAIYDVTGSASSLGIPERNTAQMLADELKAAGGIIGPDGLRHPVEIVIYDSQSDETKTVLAAKKLIEEDKVSAIVGPTQSGTTLAILDSVQGAGVPLISNAASVKITEPAAERNWVFKTAPSDRLVVGALVDYLKSQGISKVGWMSVNNAFGDSGKTEFAAAAPGAGIEIVAEEKYEATDTDMTAQLTKIQGANPQALIVWSTPPSASIVTKNAFDLGLSLPIFHSHGIANQTFIDLATKEAAEGVRFPVGKILVADQLPDSDPQKATLLEYATKYRAAFDAAPVTFGGHAWDAVKLLVQVMEKVGPDRAKIRDELEKTQGFVGIGGVFDFSPTDHAGLDNNALVIATIEDGQWKLVQK